MKVIEHLEKVTSPLLSFEITPPKRGGDISKDLEIVKNLKKYNPSFIHVTSRAANVKEEKHPEGLIKKITRRLRPGTLGLCTRIKYEYNLDSPIHILCHGFTRQETEDLLVDLDYAGLENIFAVQGDERGKRPMPADKTVNKYASDLVRQIKEMNENFCVGVAGYPEKHSSAPNLETDIRYLKQKVEEGADYIITQMFFDNEKYFKFRDRCEKEGIKVPVIPGLTTLVSKKQFSGPQGLPEKFRINFPNKLSEAIYNAEKEDSKKIGIDWTTNQAQELIDQKVPSVHFFVYDNPYSTIKVVDNLNFKKS